MSLIIEAERILIEEAAQVLRIAGKGPGDLERAIGRLGQVGGGAAGGFLGGVAGAGVGAGAGEWLASGLHDMLFGSSSDDNKKKMRGRSRVAVGKLQEQLGREIAARIRKHGMGTLFDRIAQGARLTRWQDNLNDGVRNLRGVPLGAGQDAAAIFMDAAAPRSQVSPPRQLFRSQEWMLLASVWGDFGELAARATAVMTALDAGALPDPAAGARALKSAYPAEWSAVERQVGRPLFQDSGAARRETGRKAAPVVEVPTWPSKGLPQGLQTVNPKTGRQWMFRDSWNAMSKAQRIAWLQKNGLPVEYAETDGAQRYANKNNGAGGGTGPLIVGGLAVTGLGVAAALNRRGPRKRRGKGRRK